MFTEPSTTAMAPYVWGHGACNPTWPDADRVGWAADARRTLGRRPEGPHFTENTDYFAQVAPQLIGLVNDMLGGLGVETVGPCGGRVSGVVAESQAMIPWVQYSIWSIVTMLRVKHVVKIVKVVVVVVKVVVVGAHGGTNIPDESASAIPGADVCRSSMLTPLEVREGSKRFAR